MATTEERRGLREHLLDLGFKRGAVGRDFGDGRYAEAFHNGENSIVVNWGPKTTEQEFYMPPVVERGVWRHVDGSKCTSHPDSYNFSYVEDGLITCRHGALMCHRAEEFE